MKLVAILVFFHIAFSSYGQVSNISSSENGKLINYLKGHFLTPEEYIAGKFKEYDLVMVGEFHRIKHDVELIRNLIPYLYKVGVFNLGIEFGSYEFQKRVDSLITAKDYDESLARWLMFKNQSTWGYKEYIDLYKAAWRFNSTLEKGSRPFRIIHLNYQIKWDLLKEPMTPEIEKQVYPLGSYDEHMADIIRKEFIEKKEKALIYAGIHHVFTKYLQPRYDYQKKELISMVKDRTGQLVFQMIPGRVFTIFLQAPWSSKSDYYRLLQPANGVIEKIMQQFDNRAVGFDLINTPFGELADTSYYSYGHPGFKMKDFTDGYIYMKPIREYEGCTVDTLFLNADNLQEAIQHLPNPKARSYPWTVQQLFNNMKNDADFKKRFSSVQ